MKFDFTVELMSVREHFVRRIYVKYRTKTKSFLNFRRPNCVQNIVHNNNIPGNICRLNKNYYQYGKSKKYSPIMSIDLFCIDFSYTIF